MNRLDTITKSIALGGSRRLVVVNDRDVEIKEDGSSSKRAFFPGRRWARFVLLVNEIDDAVVRAMDEKPIQFKKHLGGKLHVSVSNDVPCIDLRKWFVSKHDNRMLPTTQGIALTYRQWDAVKQAVEQLKTEVPELSMIDPCWHSNPYEMSECSECSPFGNICNTGDDSQSQKEPASPNPPCLVID